MFQTRKQLKRDIAELKEKLRKCNRLQTSDLSPCKDMYCILCEHCVMPDDHFPLVMLGCKIGAKCANFSPNEIYEQVSSYGGKDTANKSDKPV